jgi:UDP-glucose 4-epimerase
MESILVTGGAGFIGSNLIKHLLEKYPETEIYSLDNYSLGSRTNHHEGCFYIEGNTWEIETIFENHKFDRIYHFGEYSRVSQSFEDYDLAQESIQLGTSRVIWFAAQTGARLIYSASSSGLGNEGQDQALSPYAWLKSKQVEQIKLFQEWYGLEWTICYFYNVWGPGQISTGKHATVIGIWEEARANGEEIIVYGTGKQERRFTHISAVVEGIELAVAEAALEEWHLAHPEVWTIERAAQLFGQITWKPARRGERLKATELPAQQPKGWNPGPSLAQPKAPAKTNRIQ